MAENIRAHLLISGKVQGVCFRIETKRAAESRGVHGWVKNRVDGKVEALLEGDKTRVGDMVKWCWEGPTLSRVEAVEVRKEGYTGLFRGFDITY